MFQRALRYTHFPYCLEQQHDGRYVLLNRKYKPIGFLAEENVAYENFPVSARLEGLTHEIAAQLDHEGRYGLEKIFLYGDDCIPTDCAQYMANYLNRLGLLMELRVSMSNPTFINGEQLSHD